MPAVLLLVSALAVGAPPIRTGEPGDAGASIAVDWQGQPDRVWAGPNLWANRLQDWRVRAGRLECVEAAPNKPLRTVMHTGVRLSGPGTFEASVQVEPVLGEGESQDGVAPDSAAGLLIGAGPNVEPRAAALVHHATGPGAGYFCGVTADGRAFVRDLEQPWNAEPLKLSAAAFPPSATGPITITATLKGENHDRLHLDVTRGSSGIQMPVGALPAERLRGGVGLVSHPGSKTEGRTTGRWAFSRWTLSGAALEETDADCQLGPILGAKYTVDTSRAEEAGTGLLTLQAQFWPLQWEESDDEPYEMTARLELDRGDGFEPAATAPITRPDWTAIFAVDGLDVTKSTPYRVLYDLPAAPHSEVTPPNGDGNGDGMKTFALGGTVRAEPDDGRLLLGALSCNNNNRGGVDRPRYEFTNDSLWFLHTPIRDAVLKADPDLCYFAGDQIYEGSSPTRADVSGDDPGSYLDYLYKWNLWVWAYRDVTRDRPCVVVPDDHDMFQPNLWGEGGKRADSVLGNAGGFFLPPEWVNMVQITQTGNLPPPALATIPGTKVTAYYTDLTLGGVSFAVLEDRKFKTGPAGRVPDTASGRPDHIVEGDYDRSTFDDPDWQLLGEDQEAYLNAWAKDWNGNVWFKCVLSQSPFAAAATHHGPERQFLVADLDANGWPKHARDAAVAAARRGLAVMVHGDQHLSTLLKHGVESHGDAGWSFAVPGTVNIYPRWWDPKQVGGDGTQDGEPKYTGDFEDGFGNKITVLAAANPGDSGQEPAILHDRRPGWGTLEFRKNGPNGEPTVTFNNYPRGVDPTAPDARQFPGWPHTAARSEMDGRHPLGTLPALSFAAPGDSVVTVTRTDVDPSETLYTVRPLIPTFRPPVFAEDGEYTVTIVGPDGTPEVREGVTAETP